MVKITGVGIKQSKVPIPAPFFTVHMTRDKLFSLSETQFPYL